MEQAPHEALETGSHLALPSWVRYPARLALSALALTGGINTLPLVEPTPAQAYPNFVSPLSEPVAAESTNGAQWVPRYNTEDGYQVGEDNMERDKVTVLATTKNEDGFYTSVWVQRKNGSHWACGWSSAQDIQPASGGPPVVDQSPCMAQLSRLSFRSSIGEDFNGAVGAYDDGSFSYSVSPQCDGKAWRNNAALDAVTAGVPVAV